MKENINYLVMIFILKLRDYPSIKMNSFYEVKH